MTITRYRLDRITFTASVVFALMWATDQMWEQAALAASAVIILGFRVWQSRGL
jgi:hypothetical protein